MFLRRIIVGQLQANCYIVADEKGKGFIIDPGGDGEMIIDVVKKNNLDILYIIATHAHIDHIADLEKIKNFTDARFLLHPLDVPFLEDPDLNLSNLMYDPRVFPHPDRLLKNKEKIMVGSIEFEVIHTPGHTPGSICIRVNKYIFTGDTLFCTGIGRVDLPGGNFQTLQSSIRDKIFSLPEDTEIFPGHGPESTVEKEKRENPFV